MRACPGNDAQSSDDFLLGEFDIKTPAGECEPADGTPVIDLIGNRLAAISVHFTANTPLTADEQTFVDNTPKPILRVLTDSAVDGTTQATINAIREPLASAYAYRILDDLLRASELVLNKASDIETNGGAAGGQTGACDTEFVRPAIIQVRELVHEARRYRALAQVNYAKKNAELEVSLAEAREFKERRRDTLNNTAVSTNGQR
jgi:hypothetical protein